MAKFEPSKRHLREVLLFAFHSKKNAAQARQMIVETYGECCISERTCREWFHKFKNGEYDVEDKERPGPVKKFEDADLETLLDEDSCRTQQELANLLGVTQQAVSHRLKCLGMIQKLGIWVPHVSKVVKTYLETLKWDILPHLPYSPDIAPSDFYLFRLMTHDLADQHFRSYEEAKNWIDSWIASKDKQFFRRGIQKLPQRWEKVVASDGKYFEE